MKFLISSKKTHNVIKKYKYEISLLGILIFWILIMSLANENFLTLDNMLTVLRRMSETCIIAIGMTLVIITAGIDLSVGAIMALVPCLTGILFNSGVPFVLAVVIGILVGIVVGIINSVIIVKADIQAIIATLAMMTALRSIVFGLTMGKAISTFPKYFNWIGQGFLMGIPFPVILMIIFIITVSIILNKTSLGRFIYAVGGNEKAALASGIKVGKIKFIVYTFSAFLSSLSGIIFASRMATASPDAGSNIALDVIAAVLLGGTSITGGKGKILGTVIGVFIMKSMINGFNLLQINSYWQTIFLGCVLIGVVGLDIQRQQGNLKNGFKILQNMGVKNIK